MLILGLNAYHADSAACLIKDGKLIAAAENAAQGHWHKTVSDELYEPHRQAAHILMPDDGTRR